jgi:hypothetical protein
LLKILDWEALLGILGDALRKKKSVPRDMKGVWNGHEMGLSNSYSYEETET